MRPPTPLEMRVPGVFAVGDVRHGSVKRVASAVGEGSVFIPLIHAGLNDRYSYRMTDNPTIQEGRHKPANLCFENRCTSPS